MYLYAYVLWKHPTLNGMRSGSRETKRGATGLAECVYELLGFKSPHSGDLLLPAVRALWSGEPLNDEDQKYSRRSNMPGNSVATASMPTGWA